jgi:DNA primase
MAMAGIDFRTLRREVALEAVLKLLGFVPLQRHGRQVRGPCPIHASKRDGSRSFSANIERNVYRCFHCGSSGNQLDLWAAATRQPLYQAAIELCEKFHRPVPWLPRRQTRPKNPCPRC